MNGNKDTLHQKFWNAAKEAFRGRVIAVKNLCQKRRTL
jgi:hypothetical protein